MLLLILSAAFSLFISGVFLSAGFSKWQPQNQVYYQQTIENYQLVPVQWSASIVKLIAIIEIFTGALVLMPVTQKLGLILAAMMLSVYCYSFIQQLRQGKEAISCGCAGPASDLVVSPALVIRNTVLILCCLMFLLNSSLVYGGFWVISIPCALVISGIYVSVEQLLTNNQKISALRLSGL